MSLNLVPLSSVCTIVNGGTPDTKNQVFWGGDKAWITPAEMGKTTNREVSETVRSLTDEGLRHAASPLPVNSVILSTRAPIGHLVINAVPMSFNQGCRGLIPSPQLNYLYLYYFLLHSKSLLNSLGTGTTFAELSSSSLKSVLIPLPSLDEQARLVAQLEEAFSHLSDLEYVYVSEEQETIALSSTLITEQLKKVESEFGTLEMRNIFEIGRGGSPRPIKDFITTEDDGVNWIKIGDATRTGKYITDTKQKIKPSGVSRSRRVYSGELLLSNSMSFGRPYILKTDGCIHDGWVVLTPKNEVDLEYAYYALGSKFLYNQFSKLAQGSTVQNLNIDLISGAKLPLPPIEMQRTLATKFKDLEDGAMALQMTKLKSIEKVRELRASWLASVFEGGNFGAK